MDLAEFSDEQLMLLYKHGTEEAFRELFARHRDRVHRIGLRMTGEPADAEEIVQEVFLRVARAAARYEPSARFTTWLHRIAVNRALSHPGRPARARLVLLQPEAHGGPAEQAYEAARGRELGLALAREVAALAPVLRGPFVLCAGEGMPYAEAARVLGVPVGTVKTHVHRARLELRRRMQGELTGEFGIEGSGPA